MNPMANTNAQNPKENGNGNAQTQQVWATFTDMNRQLAETYAEATRAAAEAQAVYFENMLGTLRARTGGEGGNGSSFAKAQQIWTEALQETNRMSLEALQRGETPPVEEIFDLWTNAQADMIRNVIWTPGFAEAQGRALNAALDQRKRSMDQMESNLRAMGMPTRSDMMEVAKRLVELERRQHELTKLLQTLVDAQESLTMVPGAPEGETRSRRGKKNAGGGE